MAENKEQKYCSKCGKPLINQTLDLCGDCLKLEKTALPAPEQVDDKETFHLDINIKDLFTKIPPYETAENQRIWSCQEEQSKEYMELRGKLTVLAMYIARSINEGPEVKDNINKRLVLARSIIGLIFDNVAITGYDAYGILIEMQQSLFMRVDGRKYIMALLAQIEQTRATAAQKQFQGYTS